MTSLLHPGSSVVYGRPGYQSSVLAELAYSVSSDHDRPAFGSMPCIHGPVGWITYDTDDRALFNLRKDAWIKARGMRSAEGLRVAVVLAAKGREDEALDRLPRNVALICNDLAGQPLNYDPGSSYAAQDWLRRARSFAEERSIPILTSLATFNGQITDLQFRCDRLWNCSDEPVLSLRREDVFEVLELDPKAGFIDLLTERETHK